MAGFHDILGHEQIIAHLQNAIEEDKVSHAYIFNGPEASGKMMLAEAFAMALQCEGEESDHVWNVVPAGRRRITISRTLSMCHMRSQIPLV